MFIIFSSFHIFFSTLSAYFQSSCHFYLSQASPLVLCTYLYISPFSCTRYKYREMCFVQVKVYNVDRYICTGVTIFFLVLLKVFRFKKLIYIANEANQTLVFLSDSLVAFSAWFLNKHATHIFQKVDCKTVCLSVAVTKVSRNI